MRIVWGLLTLMLVSNISLASYLKRALLPTPVELPSLAVVASNLGLSRASLKSEVTHLNRQINGQVLASQACQRMTFNFCPLLVFLENYHDKSHYEKSNVANSYLKGTKASLGNLTLLQSNDYNYLTRRFTSLSKPSTYHWIEETLKTQRCPRNLSAALIRLAEEHLPDTRAVRYIEKLYKHASACLTPKDPHYEEVHMRQSLLRFLWGGEALARHSALRASLAHHQEKAGQVLYWNGLLQRKAKDRKVFWNRLVKEYPLSYYSLEVWSRSNADPYKYFRQKETVFPRRSIKDPRHIAQKGIFWVEALLNEGFTTAARKLSMELSKKFAYVLGPENVYYLSLLKAKTFSFLSASPYIQSFFKDNFRNISIEAIQIMYPQPFPGIFQKNKDLVDPNLLYAVARQESAFNPLAKSPANARGLLQLLPETARDMNNNRYANLYDPKTNVRLGAKFLRKLIRQYEGVVPALAAYNAGPARINSWKKRFPTSNPILFMDLIPYKETHDYVKRILSNHYWYENLYTSEKSVEPKTKKM